MRRLGVNSQRSCSNTRTGIGMSACNSAKTANAKRPVKIGAGLRMIARMGAENWRVEVIF